MNGQGQPANAPEKGRVDLRSIAGGAIGNLVEWYDWYVYAAFSLYFAHVFFPSIDETAQLLNTAAVFAVGFLMRPIGGWLMGEYADRKGRKAALTASVFLMCFGSLIIALTPGYETIGFAAPALLVFARLLQGLSVGGEYGASATYLSEMASSSNRGFYSSFQYVTLIVGQLLALAVLLLLQNTLGETALYNWGWRIPFLIGAACAVVAVYIRREMAETACFDENRERKSSLSLLMKYPRQVMTVVGLTLGGTVAFYTYSIYVQKFLVNSAGWSKGDATLLSAMALLCFMMIQPLVGALSDRIGRRPILIAFGVSGTLATVPILRRLADAQDFWYAFALLLSALLIVSGYTAINAVVKAELFPAEIRALGVGLPDAVTVSIVGGSAEYVALWFKSMGWEDGFYWYVTGCISISLVIYLIVPDTRRTSRIDHLDADDCRPQEFGKMQQVGE